MVNHVILEAVTHTHTHTLCIPNKIKNTKSRETTLTLIWIE